MKKKVIFFLIVVTQSLAIHCGYTQNLISNPSFEDSTGQQSLNGWITRDTSDVSFSQDVPINGGNWSLQLNANWGIGGNAFTNITGQTGTNVYQLNVWIKTGSLGPGALARVYLAFISQNQITSYKTISYGNTPNWTQYSLTDTLTIQPNDTIQVGFLGGYAQLLYPESYFDLVELKKNDTIVSNESIRTNFVDHIKIYPNPITNKFVIEINILQKQDVELKLLNMLGQLLFKEKLDNFIGYYRKEIELKKFTKGVLNFFVISNEGVFNKKIIIE